MPQEWSGFGTAEAVDRITGCDGGSLHAAGLSHMRQAAGESPMSQPSLLTNATLPVPARFFS